MKLSKLAATCLALVLVACGGSEALDNAEAITTASAAETTAAQTTLQAQTTAAPSTTTTAAVGAAPAELAGTWRTDLGGGDVVTLKLSGTSYSIQRGGNSGSGRISVEGDSIVFSGSNLCDGVGTYTWSVEGETLTISGTDAGDVCLGRAPVLDDVTYELFFR